MWQKKLSECLGGYFRGLYTKTRYECLQSVIPLNSPYWDSNVARAVVLYNAYHLGVPLR